jgi:hypothetical protein
MNHDNSHSHQEPSNLSTINEYFKFSGIIIFVAIVAAIDAGWPGLDFEKYIESFMGVFFLVFGSFKLLNLREFAYGFQSYDIVAKKSLAYAYAYPFIQLIFGILYLVNLDSCMLDLAVLAISIISSIGVFRTLGSGAKIHCVCLGNIIKLPLSKISFVEDLGMAIMSLIMIAS